MKIIILLLFNLLIFADELKFGIVYAIQDKNYSKQINDCLLNPSLGNVNGYNEFLGNYLKLCSSLGIKTENKNDKIVYCLNNDKKLNGGGYLDIINAKANPNTLEFYSSSADDNSYKSLINSNQDSFSFIVENKNNIKTYIEELYKLYSVDTTGRIKIEYKKTLNDAVYYLIDQSPIKTTNNEDNKLINDFYNYIIANPSVNMTSDWEDRFKQIRNMQAKNSHIFYSDIFKEKAFLKNLRAAYNEYSSYPLPRQNEGKCYIFDIFAYDTSNLGKNVIRSSNFKYSHQNSKYYSSDLITNYSIHKSSLVRKGIYESTFAGEEVKFSINLRALNAIAKGEIKLSFYPDASNLEIKNEKIYLKDRNKALLKREADAKYYMSGSKQSKCQLNLVDNTKELVFNLGNCLINQKNIEITERIRGFERPIFQESGKSIIKGSVGIPLVNDYQNIYTLYTNNNEKVIINNAKNSNAKKAKLVNTMLENEEYFIGLSNNYSNISRVYIDFLPNSNFEILNVYNANSKIDKITEGACAGKYLLNDELILRIKTNQAIKQTSIKYNQYFEKTNQNNELVCEQMINDNYNYTFASNDFAIRPKEFSLGISSLNQEAFQNTLNSFVSRELKNYSNLAIGIANLVISYDNTTKKFALLNNENNKITIFANDNRVRNKEKYGVAFINNGKFDLNINFPLATDGLIELAETNFTKHDQELDICIQDEFDLDSANTLKNGKISCFIPIKKALNIEFLSQTKAIKNEYITCKKDMQKCKLNQDNSIGIKNIAYDKLMLGDNAGLVYNLYLLSSNSNNKFVPTKFKNDINLMIDVGNLNGLVVNEGNLKTLHISKNDLNQAFKLAFDNLGENTRLTNLNEYSQDEASYKNTTQFTFKKDKPRPLQKVTISVYVDGKDEFNITYNNVYDIAYTGLMFKDINATNQALEFKKDYDFGYYDEVDGKLSFIKDNIILDDLLSKIDFIPTYNSTQFINNSFHNISNSSYTKDTIKFVPKAGFEYLSNTKNTFTIEFK
ncbi:MULTISPECIES: hypothetical protein [unclassified Campylobacter]|uniref:hypothetical protein n=1 Tax=unclassified Campylobacter TaxID=2593542 RepID=UPI001D991376|nr:hypothetical protein [Campylobacter sp. RM9331]MBZ8006337.1 hypothetical protein [Campylobacter sp. RM9332]